MYFHKISMFEHWMMRLNTLMMMNSMYVIVFNVVQQVGYLPCTLNCEMVHVIFVPC